jgi:hypothetical protein
MEIHGQMVRTFGPESFIKGRVVCGIHAPKRHLGSFKKVGEFWMKPISLVLNHSDTHNTQEISLPLFSNLIF